MIGPIVKYVSYQTVPVLTVAQAKEELDNLSVLLGDRVKQAIEAKGCRLQFLPTYSPDFSPIEEALSKVKSVLRRTGARTREALQEAIGQALDLVKAHDVCGWFRHCGYPPPIQDEMAQEL